MYLKSPFPFFSMTWPLLINYAVYLMALSPRWACVSAGSLLVFHEGLLSSDTIDPGSTNHQSPTMSSLLKFLLVSRASTPAGTPQCLSNVETKPCGGLDLKYAYRMTQMTASGILQGVNMIVLVKDWKPTFLESLIHASLITGVLNSLIQNVSYI